MGADEHIRQQWVDATARATRVVVVDGAGVPVDPGSGSDQLDPQVRVLTAGADRTIPDGRRAWWVTVTAAASAASPTIDTGEGAVALPAGYSGGFDAGPGYTVAGATIATVAGDIVIVQEL